MFRKKLFPFVNFKEESLNAMNTVMKDKLKPYARTRTAGDVKEVHVKIGAELTGACKDLVALLVKVSEHPEGLVLDNLSYTTPDGVVKEQNAVDLKLGVVRGDGVVTQNEVLEMKRLGSLIGNHLIQGALTDRLKFSAGVIQRNTYSLISKLRKEIAYDLNPSIVFVNDKDNGTCHQYFMVNVKMGGKASRLGVRVMYVGGTVKGKA